MQCLGRICGQALPICRKLFHSLKSDPARLEKKVGPSEDEEAWKARRSLCGGFFLWRFLPVSGCCFSLKTPKNSWFSLGFPGEKTRTPSKLRVFCSRRFAFGLPGKKKPPNKRRSHHSMLFQALEDLKVIRSRLQEKLVAMTKARQLRTVSLKRGAASRGPPD